LKDIGKKIKYFRHKHGLTQAELAKGIISYSYLSKIENGYNTTDQRIIDLICERLNISPNQLEYESDLDICKKWFRSLLISDKKNAIKYFEEIIRDNMILSNKSLNNLLEIHKLRYFILVKKGFKATNQTSVIKRISKRFNISETYYSLKFLGDYHFSRLSYNSALHYYMEAEKNINSELFFRDEEECDLYYLLALTSSKLRQAYLTLQYATKSLRYYQSTYQLMRCAKLQILIGIAYRRIGDLDKAHSNYRMAIDIGKSINSNKILYQTYQNIGGLYSSIEDYQNAIKYYNLSYELRKEESTQKLVVPVSSLMKEYYKMGEYSSSSSWLSKGLELISSLTEDDTIYFYEFKVFKQLLDENYYLLEKTIHNEVFPFLERKKLIFEKQFYNEILADYNYRMRRYKVAAQYSKEVNKSLKDLFNI
jgi:HTH-type transcriptional regulator, quorum sensing regulator NprR